MGKKKYCPLFKIFRYVSEQLNRKYILVDAKIDYWSNGIFCLNLHHWFPLGTFELGLEATWVTPMHITSFVEFLFSFARHYFFFAKPSNFLMMAMIRVHKKLTKIHKNWHCAVSSLPFGELRTQKYELLVYLAADTFIWHGLGRENPLYYQSCHTPYYFLWTKKKKKEFRAV